MTRRHCPACDGEHSHTTEHVCQGCGYRGLPLVAGGQGRSDADVHADGVWTIVLIAVALGAALMIWVCRLLAAFF